MNNSDQFRFVSLLALELDNGDITLPSLPDVVIKIRDMLEHDDCDFDRVRQAVKLASNYVNAAHAEAEWEDMLRIVG